MITGVDCHENVTFRIFLTLFAVYCDGQLAFAQSTGLAGKVRTGGGDKHTQKEIAVWNTHTVGDQRRKSRNGGVRDTTREHRNGGNRRSAREARAQATVFERLKAKNKC